MEMDNQKPPAKPSPKPRKREESPRSGLEENLPYRISGLEKAKMEPGMSPADIAALDRVIAKLKAKLAEENSTKQPTNQDEV